MHHKENQIIFTVRVQIYKETFLQSSIYKQQHPNHILTDTAQQTSAATESVLISIISLLPEY